jgi:ATP-dependent DNA helicase DinG
VPGQDLRHVIITKLPFPNPADPLTEATAEHLEQQGDNPFIDFFLPEAILRLKQGFGRLIRSQEDKGEVSILDSRIVKKRYGRQFLDALPDCRILRDSFSPS